MLSKIIRFSVNNKLIVGLFTIAFICWGVYSLSRLPIDAVPDITENQVQIITISPALGAPDVERQITIPVELANRNIPGIKQVRSFSRFGLSLVTLVFTDETDIYWARQQVSERLIALQSEIPSEIGVPELAPMSTGLGEIYQYVVKAEPGYESRYDAMELRSIQDHIVRKQLLGTPGVADVSSFGGRLKQYEISIDPNRLAASGITVTDIFTALERNNQNTGGAYIERGPTVLFIRSEGLVKTLADIENIVITAPGVNIPVLVKDVARVKFGFATRYGALVYNDLGEVSGAIVMMLKGANSSQVIKDVKAKVTEINRMLPEGVVVEPFLDRTKMVNNAIRTVETNLIEGALIVIFVLVIFLGNLRAGLIVASVIPLSMLFAVSMMNVFGVSGNLMSLGAIDFGLIVDGAVIIVEAVMHKLYSSSVLSATNRRISQQEMDEEVSGAAGKMMGSATFGQIIILVVYLPILSLQGIEGKMFKPMAETVIFALVGALLFSLTYVPMASSLFLSKKINTHTTFTDRMMIVLQRWYKPALGRILNYPQTVMLSALVLFGVAVFMLSSLGGEFIPQLEEGDFAVETRILSGSNLNTTIESVKKAAHILTSRFPEVEKVVTKIGSSEIPTEPLPMDVGDMIISLKPKKEWTSAKTFPELAEKMGEAVGEVPGISTSFQFPVQMRFNELMTGARQDVVCKIYGDDLDSLSAFASRLGALVKQVDGAEDLYVETVTGIPQIAVRIRYEALANYGLAAADVNTMLTMAFAGKNVGYVYEGEKRFDLTVRMESELRKQVDDVKNLLVPRASGSAVPLGELAEIDVKNGPYQIQRDNARRRIIIGFNIRNRDVQSVVEELRENVQAKLALPAGYDIHYGGQFENLNAAKSRLAIAVPVALLLILLLLYFAFRSLKQSMLIFTAIPLSAIGGVWALVITGMPFSISAGVGFIALFGVAVLNGIVLIAEFNRLKNDPGLSLRQVVMMGTELRLRPVLMTATVASLGFLPMALSNGAGAEVQRPLATVVIGGLITSTILTLLILPVLYIASEKLSFRKKGVAVAVLLFMVPFGSWGQNTLNVTLQQALDSAYVNNLQMQAGENMVASQKALVKSGWSLPQTDVSLQYGQYNSIVNDYQVGISQSIQFPVVYARQTALLKEDVKTALLAVENRKNEIRKRVRLVYYEWQILNNRESLLLYADSLYARLVQKAEQRTALGESNALEYNTAVNQSVVIKQQLRMLRAEKENLALLLKQLMNVTESVVPKPTEAEAKAENEAGGRLPLLEYKAQLVRNAGLQHRLEKSKLYPNLLVGYYNTGITGVQNINGTELYFGPERRHSFVNFGIGIPLFYGGSQAAKIKSAKMAVQQTEKELAATMQEWETSMAHAENNIRTLDEIIRQYRDVILPNAHKNIELANSRLALGTIDYLAWIILVNQNIQSRNEYLNQLRLYNNAIIEKQYLKGI